MTTPTQPDSFIKSPDTDTEVMRAFLDGSVFSMPDGQLQQYLKTLCIIPYDNDRVRHRALIMGITLSQLMIKNYLRRLNGQNLFLTIVIVFLTVATLLKH